MQDSELRGHAGVLLAMHAKRSRVVSLHVSLVDMPVPGRTVRWFPSQSTRNGNDMCPTSWICILAAYSGGCLHCRVRLLYQAADASCLHSWCKRLAGSDPHPGSFTMQKLCCISKTTFASNLVVAFWNCGAELIKS